MLTKRIIPCLDVTAGRVVKGLRLQPVPGVVLGTAVVSVAHMVDSLRGYVPGTQGDWGANAPKKITLGRAGGKEDAS